MLQVNNSNNRPFAKGVSSVLRPGLHPPNEGEDESFWLCAGKTSDLHKTEGVHTHHQSDRDKLTFVSQQAGF